MRTSRYSGTIGLLLVLALTLVACGNGGNGGTGSTRASTPTASMKQAATGPKGLPLYCPVAVTVDAQDNLFVSDNDANIVHERIIR
ncbi:MAG TPA: hypothetical protein VFQ30_00445 [Ktedonobacteraceae bacterium]|nr:hypothetical protein [Ktedonobacteraceae bacterium]